MSMRLAANDLMSSITQLVAALGVPLAVQGAKHGIRLIDTRFSGHAF
jgi:hypothetical protein